MTLETQYLQYKIDHPDSEITYEEWLALHSSNLAKAIQGIEEEDIFIDYSSEIDTTELNDISEDIMRSIWYQEITNDTFCLRDTVRRGIPVKVRHVQSPFILADNDFDLHECNNYLYEIGVKRTKTVKFTGGAVCIEFVKNGSGIVVQGNNEEGYNIFVLQ